MTTEAQVRFISSLVSARWRGMGTTSADEAVAAVLAQVDNLDNRGASTLIDRLKDIPEDPDPDMPKVVADSRRKGINSNTQACSACKHPVPAKSGYYYDAGTGWAVHHKVGECITTAPAAPAVEVTEGFYKVGDEIIMVYRTENQRLAGKALVGLRFEYRPGAVYSCAMGSKLTAAEAAQWGKLHGHCIACRRKLTDDGENKSVAVGYGPVCAAKYGWPWG